MRRLYLQIYATFVGILIVFVVLMSTAWWLLRERDERAPLHGLSKLVATTLPADTSSPNTLQASLDKLGEMFDADVTLFDQERRMLAHRGQPLPPPPPRLQTSGINHRGRHASVVLHLPDGRWLVASHRQEQRHFGWLFAILVLGLTVAVGSYPFVRRVTRRLENLQTSVEALGAGALDARVRVEGKDEVANLAASFNRAAERIEKLVGAQRDMLSSASHELRSPLARMRMALELLQQEDRADLREQLKSDIAELDELVGEILLASRLESIDQLEHRASIDLLALAAEEAARFNARVSGDAVFIAADRRLLRRLVRNLLDNARRHAGDTPAEISVLRQNDEFVMLRVDDLGPGIAETERERVFEPFYRVQGSRETGEGFGLGLALVKKIAQRHGGEVRCLARPGGGTRFEVTLPASQPKPRK